MPCDTQLQAGQTLEQRNSEISQALRRLEAALQSGSVKVTIAPNGALAFAGWTAAARDRVTDVCAYRTLTAGGSWALRQAVAKAEGLSGRKVNVSAIAAGVHSHDGGKTWHGGH